VSGMTLRQFALAAGTSASRLSAYEHAKVAPTTDVLGRLRHAASPARSARRGAQHRRDVELPDADDAAVERLAGP
ncbi:MAG TPA: helix-turn-helix transcriptional regulator, partial [Solirubrobacteraceae bacterium]|nr:helix-turn-helix transcriptional regulator [Solirubrobacteraceae bacterium]